MTDNAAPDRPRWPGGVATGIGSLPGTDAFEAARLVHDLLPDLPHLPELPARGHGAAMIGRTASLLVGLAVDLQPAGWRLVDRPGADLGRAVSWLRQDLDVLEEVFDGYDGVLKLQSTGPWTLAAMLEKSRGDKVVADHGARRDLTSSLAEGLQQHVTEVARRIPRAQVVLQLDEPALPTVLAGDVPTMSGFGRLRAIDAVEAEQSLRTVIEAAGVATLVHCCATDVPIGLLRRAGAAAIGFDTTLAPASVSAFAELAEAIEAGVVVAAGVVPSVMPDRRATQPAGSTASARSTVATLWHRADQPAEALAAQVVITPACGLAGASPAYARAALVRAGEIVRALQDDPEPHGRRDDA